MISGVAGGLGEYFNVDAVLFRVLFAVLSFFGGIGLLMYALAWLLIPEPDVAMSALDKGIQKMRARRVPPWLVFIGGAILLWLCWFSWWAPGPTFPALLLVAVLAVVLVHRVSTPAGQASSYQPPPAPDQPPKADGPQVDPPQPSGSFTPPIIAPLNDTRRTMQAWFSEASLAHRQRIERRRPVKVAVALSLLLGWGALALIDAAWRLPFPVYLWVGLAILVTGLAASIVVRRMTLSLLIPIAVVAAVAVVLGGTPASIKDGSGEVGWMPTSASQLSDHRQFAGQATLDLTRLAAPTSATSIRLTQAAGEVRLRIPRDLNATVISDVHIGDVQNGPSRSTGRQASGVGVHNESAPPAEAVGAPITIRVTLTVGHVQIDRVG